MNEWTDRLMDRQMNDQMDKWQMEGQIINEQKNDIIMIGQDGGQNNVQMETGGR